MNIISIVGEATGEAAAAAQIERIIKEYDPAVITWTDLSIVTLMAIQKRLAPKYKLVLHKPFLDRLADPNYPNAYQKKHTTALSALFTRVHFTEIVRPMTMPLFTEDRYMAVKINNDLVLRADNVPHVTWKSKSESVTKKKRNVYFEDVLNHQNELLAQGECAIFAGTYNQGSQTASLPFADAFSKRIYHIFVSPAMRDKVQVDEIDARTVKITLENTKGKEEQPMSGNSWV